MLDWRQIGEQLPLAEAVGTARSRLRAASPDTLVLLGVEPGGASPICDHDYAVTVFDTSIEGMGTVYCGSGRADRTGVGRRRRRRERDFDGSQASRLDGAPPAPRSSIR